MDVFSRSKPDLVSHKVIKRVNKVFQTAGSIEPSWGENIGHFYTNYIQPNLFALIIFVVIAIFLTIRYLIKQDKQDKTKKRRKRKTKKYQNDFKIRYDDSHEREYFIPQIDDRFIEEQEDDNDDNNMFVEDGDKDNQEMIDNNNGEMSDQMIKEMHETKSSRMSFDELARVICGGSS